MLRFAEEILLLLLNEENGELAPILSSRALDVVLAGAVLMDLALEDRIDTDLKQLFLVDSTPVGDDILDLTLADIAQEGGVHTTHFWIARTAERGEAIRQRAVARLVERGILEFAPGGFIFLRGDVSRSRRYLDQDGEVVEEVRLRIMRVLFSDDIPDPHDVVLISLANACGLFESILSKDELAAVRERIDLIKQLDMLGRSVAEALGQITLAPPVSTARPTQEIPQVRGWPLVGNAFAMGRDIGAFLLEQYLKSGPVFGVRAFNRHFIALVGVEANTFMIKEGKKHLRSHEFWRHFNEELGSRHVITSVDGPDHMRLRKAEVASYSRKRIEDHLEEVVHITRHHIDPWTAADKPLSARRTFMSIICEQSGILLTGMSPSGYVDDLDVFLDTMLKVKLTRQYPALWMRLPKVRRARERVEELSARALALHDPAKRAGQEPDFIDDLLELHRADPQLMPETDLMIASLGPFLVGLDTAANACAFMLYALLKHPYLLARMTTEADAMFSQGMPTPEALKQLDASRRILMETLRVYPIVPALTRTVSNSFEFEGYTIPAGTQVLIGTTVPHKLPAFFPQPHRFDIDRYTAKRAEHRQQGAYAPFGLGAHSCLGGRFAEVQIMLTLATILHEFELALEPADHELKIKQVPHPRPSNSFKFRIVRRRPRG